VRDLPVQAISCQRLMGYNNQGSLQELFKLWIKGVFCKLSTQGLVADERESKEDANRMLLLPDKAYAQDMTHDHILIAGCSGRPSSSVCSSNIFKPAAGHEM
jgi:hypothetical protein